MGLFLIAILSRVGSTRIGHTHVDRHSFYHTGINGIELLYQLRHLASLLVNVINSGDLLAGALELHLVNAANASQRAIEVFHLLAIAGKAIALLIDFL